jgi:glycerol uptake facilitator protein
MKLPNWFVGEFVGTFLLVFFGCGSVAAAVTMGAQVGVFQVAIIWGLGIATAIYLTGSLSGAHLNPAVSVSMAVWGGFAKSRVVPYVITQLLGAFVAALLLHGIFANPLAAFEARNGIVRGSQGSEASAKVYGEYFPSPGPQGLDAAAHSLVTQGGAFAAEVTGTALLLLVIFATTDPRNESRQHILAPLTIGLTVTMLISLLGPLTMACFNPARDLAPRLFSSLAGWGSVPFTANGMGWFTVYLVAPIIGGLLGGLVYTKILKPGYHAT